MALLGYGAYIPRHKIARSTIATTLGARPVPGARTVASYDEDTSTMGVAAARNVIADVPAAKTPDQLWFSTTSPAYLDKANATLIHAALQLDPGVLAFDAVGSVRSSAAAISVAAGSTARTLVVLSDIRTGLPGSVDESGGGDGACALLFGEAGPAPAIAELVVQASVTDELLDRWRLPASRVSRSWEERFVEHAYEPIVRAALHEALDRAELKADQIHHLVVAGVPPRVAAGAVRACGLEASVAVDAITPEIGIAGCAHPGLLLCDALDRAGPGEIIALVVVGGGATVLAFRTCAGLAANRSCQPLGAQVRAGREVSYLDFLAWRGHLTKEPPRRPEPEAPAAPPTARSNGFKHALLGSQCGSCGLVHLPPSRVCPRCSAIDAHLPVELAGRQGVIASYTIDHLAHSPNPPVVAAAVDIDGGGRFRCQLTDVDPGRVASGDRVEMTFRLMGSSGGIHNYFWKARPLKHKPGDVQP